MAFATKPLFKPCGWDIGKRYTRIRSTTVLMIMQTFAIILVLVGIVLAAFVGFPLRTRLGNRLGQDDFQNKLQDARKAGDPLAKRLFLVGWASGAFVILGIGLLLFGSYF